MPKHAPAGLLAQFGKEVQLLLISDFSRADEKYGKRAAEKLGIEIKNAIDKAHAKIQYSQ